MKLSVLISGVAVLCTLAGGRSTGSLNARERRHSGNFRDKRQIGRVICREFCQPSSGGVRVFQAFSLQRLVHNSHTLQHCNDSPNFFGAIKASFDIFNSCVSFRGSVFP